MKAIAALFCIAVSLAPLSANAQTTAIDAEQKSGVAGVFKDLAAESPAYFLRDAGGHSPGKNRVVIGVTIPRSLGLGLCSLDGFTIVALPERDAAATAETALIRQVETERRYYLIDNGASSATDEDAACAALAKTPALRERGARTNDFFAAPDPSAAMTTGLLVRKLGAQTHQIETGPLRVVCQRRCPSPSIAKRLFEPTGVLSVHYRPICAKGRACYSALLSSRRSDGPYSDSDSQLWKLEFAVPFGAERRFEQISLTPLPILQLGDDVLD
ncbi:hypothetical protein [Caulobacter hibisci]|uniref:Uncharacterized protein n=1 Tax=Caulobacter hibisci TaxID=2035993 RepID=A0ABS0SZL5_9CAUL|nr:hypothetical protein [Caulobacter hibisci]MBI1685054.1 hypothetical protein [Caulobacter hibisci]